MDTKDISAEIIAELCLRKYRELPKTGKPTNWQWSVLAGIVLYNVTTKSKRVISLGLGTKCIGAGKLCRNGFILNDSHAEVLARRGLLRFLYHEIRQANSTQTNDSIFAWDGNTLTYDLKPDYSFHFFCTHSPCGDACIVEVSEEPPAKMKKFSHDDVDREIGELLPTVYTGAKLFDTISENGDRMAQTTAALRIKPGKGDRTLSMACSDKISKWCFIGIQGALLDCLLTSPIYIKSFTFCSNSDVKALKRAIYERWISKAETQKIEQQTPQIQICEYAAVSFECQKSALQNQPSPSSIAWCDLAKHLKPFEVVVDGKRQGCTKKSIGTAQAAVHISKYHLFKEFLQVLKANDSLKQKLLPNEANLETLSYRKAKNLAANYQKAWTLLKTDVFEYWAKKPNNLEDFCAT